MAPPIRNILASEDSYDTDIEECFVCKDTFAAPGENGCHPIRLYPCKHVLGRECFMAWIQHSLGQARCPYCTNPVKNQEDVNISTSVTNVVRCLFNNPWFGLRDDMIASFRILKDDGRASGNFVQGRSTFKDALKLGVVACLHQAIITFHICGSLVVIVCCIGFGLGVGFTQLFNIPARLLFNLAPNAATQALVKHIGSSGLVYQCFKNWTHSIFLHLLCLTFIHNLVFDALVILLICVSYVMNFFRNRQAHNRF